MSKTIGAILDRQEQLDSVVFDLISERKTSRTRQLTSHAIEEGSLISDNTIDNNIVISFRAEIGNIDIENEGVSPTAAAAAAYESLRDIYNKKSIIDYQTCFETIRSMIITSFEQTDTPTKTGALQVDIVLEEVNITQGEQVEFSPDMLGGEKAQKQFGSEINKGKQDLAEIVGNVNLVVSHERTEGT